MSDTHTLKERERETETEKERHRDRDRETQRQREILGCYLSYPKYHGEEHYSVYLTTLLKN